jgi:Flp pilus assembly protein TadG
MLRSRPSAKRKRRGGAIVEMAAVMPIFLVLILGQIESSRLGMVSQLLATAAREGSRVAVINGNTNADVQNSVNAYLSTANITGATMTQTPTDCTTVHASDSPNTITVTVTVSYGNVSWLPAPYFLKNASLSASATMSSERP